MDIFKIILIGIVTCVASIILKQVKPELAFIAVISGGLIILLSLVDMLAEILQTFTSLSGLAGINSGLFSSVLKIVGIGYISEFGANICLDSGNSSLSDKILLAGKLIIMVVSLPIIQSLIEVIKGLVV